MFLQCLRIIRNVARAAEKVVDDPAAITAAIQEFGRSVPDLDDLRGFATYHASYVAGLGKPYRGVVPGGYQLYYEQAVPSAGGKAHGMFMYNAATWQKLEVVGATGAARRMADKIVTALREPPPTARP